MGNKLDCQTFPVEENPDQCYNTNGANDVQDAAEKGAAILCHITKVKPALDLECDNAVFLDFISYCLDCLEKGQSVQTIWTDYQAKVAEHAP